MSKARGLPPRQSSFSRVVDELIDPPEVNRGISDTRGTSGAEGAAGGVNVQVRAEKRSGLGTPGTRGTSDTSSGPVARQHVKVRSDLADELRAAVWFLSAHGRPRVQLGELLDEAVASWLVEARAQHNGGMSFPDRGPLR